jgi:2,3-bisphosphoglycerate-dependent phosphoglycerate mutase
MSRLVILRHGQSAWNQQNRFTGWVDVDLTAQGAEEGRRAGQFLREAGFSFDIAYTSLLKRAIRTLWLVLDELDLLWLPVEKTWRLNERHYGALQGLDKAEMVDRYGKEQVFLWRRSYDVQPPALAPDDARHPRFDARYNQIDPAQLPATESLEGTLRRVLPCWQEAILPRLRAGERVLVVAHGNSLRALIKHLDGIADKDVAGLSVPTGIPIAYELDDDLRTVRRAYIGDAEIVRAAVDAAAASAKVKGKKGIGPAAASAQVRGKKE